MKLRGAVKQAVMSDDGVDFGYAEMGRNGRYPRGEAASRVRALAPFLRFSLSFFSRSLLPEIFLPRCATDLLSFPAKLLS